MELSERDKLHGAARVGWRWQSLFACEQALALLAAGHNVAVVFGPRTDGGLPATWDGYRVIDGDEHDLRFLDPRNGVVVGLSPKGMKAKRDMAGFVVR